MSGGRALLRVDASPAIGFGHLTRTLALADELATRGWRISMACRQPEAKVRATIQGRGFTLLRLGGDPAAEPAEIARLAPISPTGTPFDWVILDHYDLGATWLADALAIARKRLVIDDLVDRRIPAEIIVNPDPAITAAAYAELAPGADVLAGPRFALLGRTFAELHAAPARTFGPVGEVLVSFGGSDPLDLTRPALEAISRALPEAAVTVAIGPGYRRDPSDLAAPGRKIIREPTDLPSLMAAADLAVGAAGTSVWERCALGLPSVVIVSADNQRANARALKAAGAARVVELEDRSDTAPMVEAIAALGADAEARRKMSTAGWSLVDGLGAVRVADHLEDVRVRPAQASDEDLLWRWANDPATRANSLSTDAIPLATHRHWFREQLARSDTVLLVGENGAGPIGQVRFDLAGREATISISVAPGHRGGGLGGLLLRSSLAHLQTLTQVQTVRAIVKKDNRRSIDMFDRAHFVISSSDDDVLEMRHEMEQGDHRVAVAEVRP